jgi:hypothetical protein
VVILGATLGLPRGYLIIKEGFALVRVIHIIKFRRLFKSYLEGIF